MTSPKPGHPLATIAHFQQTWLETLRDELSVTTAEEFLNLAYRLGPQLADVIGTDPAGLAAIVHLVEVAAPGAMAVARASAGPRFMTGQDAPEPGRDTFEA